MHLNLRLNSSLATAISSLHCEQFLSLMWTFFSKLKHYRFGLTDIIGLCNNNDSQDKNNIRIVSTLSLISTSPRQVGWHSSYNDKLIVSQVAEMHQILYCGPICLMLLTTSNVFSTVQWSKIVWYQKNLLALWKRKWECKPNLPYFCIQISKVFIGIKPKSTYISRKKNWVKYYFGNYKLTFGKKL